MVKRNPNGTRFITLPNGYHLWTQTLGSGPIQLLTLHGGPGGTNEVFENFAAELASFGVRVSRYDQLGSFSLINRTFPIRLIKSAFSISRIMLTKWKMFGNSWVLIIFTY